MMLLAMGLEGLTPDARDLASSWLLGTLASTTETTRFIDLAHSPLHDPGSTDPEDGRPGEVCTRIDLAFSVRVRHEEGVARLSLPLVRITFVPRGPEPCRLTRSSRMVERRAESLIPALCRFLC